MVIEKNLNMIRNLRDLATLLKTYNNELLNAGFDEDTAFTLTSQYQYILLNYIYECR